MIKLTIITGPALRHKFFANTLAERYDILGVVSEAKRPNQSSEVQTEDDLLKDHFQARDDAEQFYFGNHHGFVVDPDRIFTVPYGGSNSLETFEWIRQKKPDYVILFGSSIIKPPLLEYYDKKIINMHLGLSPYYRGSGTNFWPLVNNEPECVGATIHLATLKVDAGSILAQVRPENMTERDNSHDIGCKTIISGAHKMAECIGSYDKDKSMPKTQDSSHGRVYKRADFNAQAVEVMKENFQKGMIKTYLDHKQERDARFPIVEI